MKQLFLIFSFSFLGLIGLGQRFSNKEINQFSSSEDSLKKVAIRILQGFSLEERRFSDSSFTKILVRALKKNNSFYYTFPSLKSISILYPPDSSFRIFTWQMKINEDDYVHHGAIQINKKDGSLKLIPLFDKSNDIENPEDTVANNLCWIGAIYYKILQTTEKDNKIYTLLGYNEFGMTSNKKMIEVLHFDNDVPVFGGDYFNFPKDESISKKIARFIMEYKKNATPRLNYDEDLKMIIKEHLISETNEPEKKYSLIGDGDYEGFVWKNGKWNYILKVFDTITPNGRAPIPSPIRDKDGRIDDKKLKEPISIPQ